MPKAERQIDKSSVWEPTRYTNLFRYVPSGAMFARFKIRGKQVRKSLKTTNLELAKNKLAELERKPRVIDAGAIMADFTEQCGYPFHFTSAGCARI
jgi:hypothetical protein